MRGKKDMPFGMSTRQFFDALNVMLCLEAGICKLREIKRKPSYTCEPPLKDRNGIQL